MLSFGGWFAVPALVGDEHQSSRRVVESKSIELSRGLEVLLTRREKGWGMHVMNESLDQVSIPLKVFELAQEHSPYKLSISLLCLTTVHLGVFSLTSITSLNLSHNNLTSLPNEIGRMTWLRRLSVKMNRELEQLPSSLSLLVNLVSLDASFCHLKNVDSIRSLTTLRKLNVRRNCFDRIPFVIATLPSLIPSKTHINQDCCYVCERKDRIDHLEGLLVLRQVHHLLIRNAVSTLPLPIAEEVLDQLEPLHG